MSENPNRPRHALPDLRNPALVFLQSPTPTAFASQTDLSAPPVSSKVAVDPITLAINECLIITSAMRKMTRWSQSGVAAILSGSDLFGKDESLSSSLGISALPNGRTSAVSDNPLLSSFIQLRSILTDAGNLDEIDSLTLLQPFLMVVKSSSTSGQITSLALNSITKFINYEIISVRSKNLQTSLIQIVSALTHCRFEAADQNSDDAVLLKVLRLVEMVLNSVFSTLLPNEIVFEVVQTCLSLACNKKRSEVLRKAAEMTMTSIVGRIFGQLRVIEPEAIRVDDLQTDFTGTQLPEDVIGSADTPNPAAPDTEKETEDTKEDVDADDEKSVASVESDEEQKDADDSEEPFGISCLNDSLGILISMISPSNQYQHMESTRVLALRLINTAIEVSGKDIPKHASLMNLISDPVSKHVLQIITTADSPALLQAALQLFATLAIVLGDQLKSQIELTFTLLFKSIIPSDNKSNDALKGNAASVSNRLASSKEMLLEAFSLLWIREPYFFTRLYIDFDCDFDRSDLVSQLIDFICKLALPESARITTDNVPPICLEGLLSFVSGINERVKHSSTVDPETSIPASILNKRQKNTFIKCTEVFNEKPANGLKALTVEGFIKDSNNVAEVAEFIFKKSGRLHKKVLGEYLAKQDNKEVLKEFINLFEFEGLRVDEALRLLLKSFRLPGESQQIERIVETFAEKYVQCQENYNEPAENGEEFVKPLRDDVFILSYSVIMLNTDLHNPVVKQQMTLEAYRKNLAGTYRSGNYPEWYLSKIYNSIKDKEIIMPEEHHGTNKWFDDVWHNLVSSQATLSSQSLIDDMTPAEISQFDHQLFEENVDKIIETLVQVFKEATDDHIITRLMSTVDKCVNVCLFYGIESSVDKLIGLLANLTSLAGGKIPVTSIDDNVREDIPITQIKIDKKDEAITVSNLAVWFGRDFKAQISTVVLFRLIKKTDCKVTKSWDKVIRIIFSLFENCLINPNLFTDFQKKLRLPPLPKVKPRYIINRSKPLKDSGLLSTFSSFLKGYSDDPPEPTDQEVESTLSSIDCVKSLNIANIFQMISHADSETKRLFVELLLNPLPKDSEENKRFYESEILFIFEITICLCLLVSEPALTTLELSKLHSIRESKNISKKGHLRLTTYKLLLLRNGSASHKAILDETLNSLLEFDKEVITKNGQAILQPLISLVDDDSWCKDLMVSEVFWKVLRLYGGIPVYASQVLEFVETVMKQSPQEIVPANSMLILGLLDEVSSLGAIAAQWEQETEKLQSNGQKSSPNNDYLKELIDLSKKSINLTADLVPVISKDDVADEGGYSLIQALAHQCFNPCREVRTYALSVLKTAVISSIEHNSKLSPFGAFELGLFPLLDELAKPTVLQTDISGFITTQMDALSLIGKVFLQYTAKFSEEELGKAWFQILDSFQKFSNIREKNPKNASLIQESGSEILKNMILVLQTSDILSPEKEELWVTTWEKVDAVYPALKQDLLPEAPKQESESQAQDKPEGSPKDEPETETESKA